MSIASQPLQNNAHRDNPVSPVLIRQAPHAWPRLAGLSLRTPRVSGIIMGDERPKSKRQTGHKKI